MLGRDNCTHQASQQAFCVLLLFSKVRLFVFLDWDVRWGDKITEEMADPVSASR